MLKRKAIIVLSIVFLFSLLLPSGIYAAASRHASSVVVSNIDAEANGDEKVLVNIYLRNGTNDPDKGTVFIATDRGSTDKFWVKKNKTWVSVSSLSKESGDNVYYISRNTIQAEIDGNLELGLTSKVKGNVTVGVSLKGEHELRQFLSGHLTAAQAEIIPIKFTNNPKTVIDNKYYKVATKNENSSQYVTYTENKVYINILDKANKVATVEDDIRSIDLSGKVINKPEGVNTSIQKSPNWEKELRETGSTYLLVSSDKPGQIELDVNLKLKYKNSFSPDSTLNTTTIIDIVPQKFGASEITLFLNQNTAVVDDKIRKLELVPFIQNSRTFVPVRFLGEALGAEVVWNPDTQTVVLSRPDKMITMTIGNSALLLNNGQVVLSDVPPFIKDGYTVLPFRAIAEAFGAKVSVGYNDIGEMDKVMFYNK